MKKRVTLFLSILLLPITLKAEVSPNPLFSEHCVLQQASAAPIWGKADPGESVIVRFRGKKAKTTADENGDWKVTLPTGKAGGPYSLSFIGSKTPKPIVREDVLVGEVWIASGQSNMDRQLGPDRNQGPIINAEAEAAKADYPTFRVFSVRKQITTSPLESVEGSWIICTPETANNITAVGFFFGRDLLAALNVPVGLITTSWGGSPAEAWTSEQALEEFPEFSEAIAHNKRPDSFINGDPNNFLDEKKNWFEQNDLGSQVSAPWYSISTDDQDWSNLSIPSYFEPYAGEIDGIIWFRKTITLPDNWTPQNASLRLGAIDDADTTWVNGVQIGRTYEWGIKRDYPVPTGLLKPGKNVISVRVLDHAGNGGIFDTTTQLALHWGTNNEESLPLTGSWKYRVGLDFVNLTEPHPFSPQKPFAEPTVLFNGMLKPLIPYSIRGVIWYQGESNANNTLQYRKLFPTMIADWRNLWGIGDFPFLYVQIAPYEDQPPEIREAQLLTLERSPNTAMTVTMDVGDAHDIHPTNKEPVGERLALAARALAYGEQIAYSGPLYKSFTKRGNEIVIHFTHTKPGLTSGALPLRGFTLAGTDGVFHPAEARFEGDTVVVVSPDVEKPTNVRYGWANVADGNLFNNAGLPASPFRSDSE